MALAAAGAAFVVLGWAGHAWWEAASAPAPVHALREGGHSSPGGGSRATEPSRVLVHVTSGRLDALAAALDEVEDLLRSAGRSVEVEIVANHAGLELFRAGPAPLAQRVEALRSAYPNLSLVACGESLERQRAGGRPVELLPGTAIASSALERVIERQKGGWVYVRS
jgi:intracellular sulfur oxidation DsrE/DsrF family protein